MKHYNLWQKRLASLAGAALGILLLAQAPAALAWFQPGGTTDPNFEIDVPANAMDQATSNGNYAGDDWQTVYKCFPTPAAECAALNGLNANLINTTGILNDPAPYSIYTTGGSKDPQDVTQWRWKDGSVPDKDNILHAGAAAYGVSNELIMYIFADRYSNDGDAMMGAWFFQDVVKLIDSGPDAGKFTGRHKNGDILWLGHFSGGGVVANLQVMKWNDPNLPDYKSACTNIKGTNLCLVSEGQGGGTTGYFASVNNGNTPSPWPYTPKQGTPGQFPYNNFMEGGINITQMLGATPCFSSFLIESRSSTSVSATLKDFVLGQIDTCKIDVKKTCTSKLGADGASIDDEFVIEAKNIGFAPLTSVDLSDDRHTPNSWTWSGALNPNGWQEIAKYTVNTTTQNLSNKVTAVGKTAGGYATTPAESTGTCPTVPVNPGLVVIKDCDKTQLEMDTSNNRLWVKVSSKIKVCNTGDVRLTVNTLNDRYNDTDHNITALLPTTTLNPPGVGPAQSDCVSVSNSYYPNLPVGTGVTAEYNVASQCFAGVAQHWVDRVRASATPALGTGPVNALADQADCPLCPVPACAP